MIGSQFANDRSFDSGESSDEFDTRIFKEQKTEQQSARCRAPFSDDPEAIARRAAVDYSEKITLADAKAGKTNRQVRVYADGVFDLFHIGHARCLEQAKNVFPNVYLIAGIPSDAAVNTTKGITVMDERERYEIVQHCRYVDEVYCGTPHFPSVEELRGLKIDFVAHDPEPYPMENGEDYYEKL